MPQITRRRKEKLKSWAFCQNFYAINIHLHQQYKKKKKIDRVNFDLFFEKRLQRK